MTNPTDSELQTMRVSYTLLFSLLFGAVGFLYAKAGGPFSLSSTANAIIVSTVGGILIYLRFGMEDEYR